MDGRTGGVKEKLKSKKTGGKGWKAMPRMTEQDRQWLKGRFLYRGAEEGIGSRCAAGDEVTMNDGNKVLFYRSEVSFK